MYFKIKYNCSLIWENEDNINREDTSEMKEIEKKMKNRGREEERR